MPALKDSMNLLLLALIVTMESPGTDAYNDQRGLSCANTELMKSIPANRVTWEGFIQIEMNCQAGFDWALNAPSSPLFNCKPDGSAWDPPIFPDCNALSYPSKLRLLYAVAVPQPMCKSIKHGDLPPPGVSTVSFESNAASLEFTLCPPPAKFNNCTVKVAEPICDVTYDSVEESVRELNMEEPHIAMAIEVSCNKNMHWRRLNENVMHVKRSLKEELTNKGVPVTGEGTFSRIKAVCASGTIGVVKNDTYIVCRGCSLGHYLDEMNKVCEPCPPGYYADRPNLTSCQLCPSLAGYNDSAIWARVEKSVRDRAYTIVLCPTITRDKTGRLHLEVAPDQPPSLYQRSLKRGSYTKDGTECVHATFSSPALVLACVIYMHLLRR